MEVSEQNRAILALEETLQILEECIQENALDLTLTPVICSHIQRLKSLYSPEFDFEHSESGSYFYAAIRCSGDCFLSAQSKNPVPLSDKFRDSFAILQDISLLSLSYKKSKLALSEKFMSLSELWGLRRTMNVQQTLIAALSEMRTDLLNHRA